MPTVKDLISFAESQIGYIGHKTKAQLDVPTANKGGKYTMFAAALDALGDFYYGKKNGYDYCAVFCHYCFTQVFGVASAREMLNLPKKSYAAAVNWCASYFSKKKRLFDSPEVGDMILYRSTDGRYIHTGIVKAVTSKYITTVEGNVSVGDGFNGVKEKKQLRTKVLAKYGRPLYPSVSVEPKPAPVVTEKPPLPDAQNAEPKEYVPKVGDVVIYNGDTHYTSANAKTAKKCKGGKAVIKAIYKVNSAKHPYNLLRVIGCGATVHGWVDKGTFAKSE